jgi:hypothetical protein
MAADRPPIPPPMISTFLTFAIAWVRIPCRPGLRYAGSPDRASTVARNQRFDNPYIWIECVGKFDASVGTARRANCRYMASKYPTLQIPN